MANVSVTAPAAEGSGDEVTQSPVAEELPTHPPQSRPPETPVEDWWHDSAGDGSPGEAGG